MRGRIRGGSLRSSKLQIALVVSAGLRRRFVAAVEPKWKEHLVDIGIPVEACQEPSEALAQGYAQLNQAEGSDVQRQHEAVGAKVIQRSCCVVDEPWRCAVYVAYAATTSSSSPLRKEEQQQQRE